MNRILLNFKREKKTSQLNDLNANYKHNSEIDIR